MKYTKLVLFLVITLGVFGFSFVGSAIDGDVKQLVAAADEATSEATEGAEEKTEEGAEAGENSREAEMAKEREQTEAK
ncbi:MAG: hypothetical protein AAF462_00685 [Thermodesulfobacteriota bacterium]